MSDYRDELRAKKPAKACSADHENSRAAAIELHCETHRLHSRGRRSAQR